MKLEHTVFIWKSRSMRKFFYPSLRLGLAFILSCVSVFSYAISMNIVSDSDNRASIAPGSAISVQLTGVSGSISISNTNSTAVTVTRVSGTSTTATFRLSGVSTGIANITFKDTRGRTTAYLKVPLRQGTLDGRQLASNCFQCHGTNGTGGFERLMGESYAEIYSKLVEFLTEIEEEGELMSAHAMGYTDAQMQALANYLAQLR